MQEAAADWTKKQIEKSTIIRGQFNISLTVVDKDLIKSIKQCKLLAICEIFYSAPAE